MTDGSHQPPTPTSIEATVACMQRQFPGVVVWFGRATLRWWAIGEWPGLLEAVTPEQLATAIATARSWGRQ